MDYKSYALCDDDSSIYNDGLHLAESDAYKDCRVRLMPDAHRGKAGCCVGTVIEIKDKVVPNTVGVDICCSVSALEIPNNIDLAELDSVIRNHVPSGSSVHSDVVHEFNLSGLKCWEAIANKDRIAKSMGTLGASNHFLSVEVDDRTGQNYLMIHCGSRNLGVQVCEHYQRLAVDYCKEKYTNEKESVINQLKASGLQHLISQVLGNMNPVDEQLAYLEGDTLDDYLHDMKILEKWVYANHRTIYRQIAKHMSNHFAWSDDPAGYFVSHNYIDVEYKILRKGAISARDGQIGLIPLNMKDGTLLVVGKGNDDWLCSLPHGAGRKMSRSQARKTLFTAEYINQMADIYTTSVSEATLDEAPMCYKDADDIASAIVENADIVTHFTPIYNFKAKE